MLTARPTGGRPAGMRGGTGGTGGSAQRAMPARPGLGIHPVEADACGAGTAVLMSRAASRSIGVCSTGGNVRRDDGKSELALGGAPSGCSTSLPTPPAARADALCTRRQPAASHLRSGPLVAPPRIAATARRKAVVLGTSCEVRSAPTPRSGTAPTWFGDALTVEQDLDHVRRVEPAYPRRDRAAVARSPVYPPKPFPTLTFSDNNDHRLAVFRQVSGKFRQPTTSPQS